MVREPVGALLRVYSTKPELVLGNVDMIQHAIGRLFSIHVAGQPALRQVDILVWADERYAPESDCGLTAAALREAFKENRYVVVHEVKRGDLFCGILNFGVLRQATKGMHWTLILSKEAFPYVTVETMEAVYEAASRGARAVGVALNELTDSICQGRIANTFALWHIESLGTVGGFDLRAAKPTPGDKLARYAAGYSPKDRGEVFYHVAGVEEVRSLARMVQLFGKCIAPVLPRGEGLQRYVVPDPTKDPEGFARHWKKMGTKEARQAMLLAELGCDLSYLEGGVMDEYWQPGQ